VSRAGGFYAGFRSAGRPIDGALRRVKRCHRQSRKEPAVTNLRDVLTGSVLDPHWRPVFV
jgi:hypothetical protein